MDILLTHGYHLAGDPAEERIMKPYVPLGILSIAAYLGREGFRAGVFDTTFESPSAFAHHLATHRPPLVGIYVNMMTRTSALAMVRAARAAGAFVIVGGPEPPYYAAEFLAGGADAVVIGEGELTVTDLLRLPDRSADRLRSVAGIAFRDETGAVVTTPPRPQIADVDALPFPDRSKAPIRNYLEAWRGRHGYASLSLIAQRGCPYTCKWCSHAVYGESYRRRSPRLVVEELMHLRDAYTPDAFWFADDVFTINHRWMFEFEKELLARAGPVRYECITRADRLNEEIVRALKSTGCTRVWIGSESGSQRILDAMSRGVRVEQVQAMTRLARSAGIEVGMFIMLGYPGETRRDIEATVRHLKKAQPDIVLTTVAYPIKGTTFYEESSRDLILPELPFAEWNDRMIGIAGRYTRRFYWFANRRVINEAAWSLRRSRGIGGATRAFLKAKAAQVGMYLTH
jgi:radical SAM superfamily enzyme YgiQ (UPF0313 family)